MNNLKTTSQKKIIIFLSALSLLLAAAVVHFSLEASKLHKRERLINERAVSSLCESLDSISTSLNKGRYTFDGQALLKIGNELSRQASAAKESLNSLGFEGEMRDELYKFLSQVGNYTIYLAGEDNFRRAGSAKKLGELCTYAEKLSRGMNEICLDYYKGNVDFAEATKLIGVTESPVEDFFTLVYDAAQTMTDYPTLVYDGPFADNLASGRSQFLENEKEITAEEAKKKVSRLLGVKESALRRERDVDSKLSLYCFSLEGADITITKKGGYLCTLLSDAFVTEETISPKEAIKRGEEYLDRLGYESMVSSYYSLYDGICTINYAFSQNGVIHYGDLIKVSIGLDTGKLLSLDARSYLLNHRTREKPKKYLSLEEGRSLVMPSLKVIGSRYAVIPLDSGKEAFCIELHCRDEKGQELLIYLNAETGRQEDILLLLYSDEGVLTK